MTLPSKNAYLSRRARAEAQWEKLVQTMPRIRPADQTGGPTLEKYRKRITLARTSIEKDSK